MVQCVVAAGTSAAARAGAAVVEQGGNAVDAAVAAVLAAWVCEPGVTAMGSAAIAIIRGPDGETTQVDGITAMPGLGGHAVDPAGGARVTMPYGPGVETGVDVGSIAVPGGPAAIEAIHRRGGVLAWADVVEPARRLAAEGFLMPQVSCNYLPMAGPCIYDRTPGARACWRDPSGRPYEVGDRVVLDALAGDLALLARHGTAVLYEGELGHRIADWIVEHGGAMSRADLAAYRPVLSEALVLSGDAWSLTSAETVGGRTVIALWELIGQDATNPDHDLAGKVGQAVLARDAMLQGGSGSTTQVSTVDADGLACSVTSSTGYGSGIVVPGTGMMLNNMLGELELLPGGPSALEPGVRLPSNMAPTIATRGGDVVAIGSAGAARIPTAIAQVLRHVIRGGVSAQAAVDAPRLHVRTGDDGLEVHLEPGADPGPVSMGRVDYEAPHMFFGGVQMAMRTDGTLDGAGDPRRGGTVIKVTR